MFGLESESSVSHHILATLDCKSLEVIYTHGVMTHESRTVFSTEERHARFKRGTEDGDYHTC